MAIEESGDAGFDGGGLLLKGFFARRKEEDQFGVGKGLGPFEDVVGV